MDFERPISNPASHNTTRALPQAEQELGAHNMEGETASCRICRGEETSDESLFYPCKCSGSIRYVHQACLMEWLSRSGKRHCELCKTPFRFTKLYDPSMPASVPVPVFAQQAALQVVGLTLRVARWVLVLFVWLAWVPWVMRLMWRFLFWLADGAWIEHPFHYDVGLPGSLGTLSITAYSRRGAPNTTINEQVAALVSSVSNVTVKPTLFNFFREHVSKLLWEDTASPNSTSTTSQPLMLRLGVRLFKGIFPLASRKNTTTLLNSTNSSEIPFLPAYRQTLLSDVGYLKTFTKWPFVNRIMIDILEGQMITVFVVVFLILVFLIREWVVQQQPGAGAPRNAEQLPAAELVPAPAVDNLGHPENLDEDREEMIDQAPAIPATGVVGTIDTVFEPHWVPETDADTAYMSITAQNPHAQYSFEELRLNDYGEGNVRSHEGNQSGPEGTKKTTEGTGEDEDEDWSSSEETRDPVNGRVQTGVTGRPLGLARDAAGSHPSDMHISEVLPSSNPDFSGQTVSDSMWSIATNPSSTAETAALMGANHGQRPQMPSRNALDRASRLHRVLEEERNKVDGDRWPSITTFMDYWNRGNCDPQVVLDLIHEERRDQELAWIVQAMKRLQRAEDSDSEEGSASENAIVPSTVDEPELSNSSHGSWQVVEGQPVLPEGDRSLPQSEVLHGSVDEASTQSLPQSVQVTDFRAINEDNQTIPVQTFNPSQAQAPQAAVIGVSNQQPDILVDVRGEQQNDSSDTDESRVPTPDSQSGASATEIQTDEAIVPAPRTFWHLLGDLMWGGVDLLPADQVQVAGQLQPVIQPEMEHEALAPQLHDDDGPEDADMEADADVEERPAARPDPEVLQAARDAGLDPEDPQAVEEGEDLDGLVELIGLEGPLLALLQHAVVCAAIVSLVVFLGIWIPYIIGKAVLVILSNPVTLLLKLPLRCVFFAGELLLDSFTFLSGGAFFWLDRIIRLAVSPLGWAIPWFATIQKNTVLADTAIELSDRAMNRLIDYFTFSGDGLTDSDIPYFSIVAHESLVSWKNLAYGSLVSVYKVLQTTLEHEKLLYHVITTIGSFSLNLPYLAWRQAQWDINFIASFATTLLSIATTNPLKLRLDFPERAVPLDLSLIHWSAWDRVLAIAMGYTALYVAGCMYTRVAEAFKKPGEPNDDTVEVIYQACGVLKVILIISIEMIAFPLYCGVLLDIAMLPLFRDATVLSRLAFTARSPWTSLFLHWFVGTCYMFHFALFVSMCRKEMRKGVLYFIRDPDDETFHPVRDVLERNLGGQLRKIAFSALVYGALVMLCLGSVVWAVGSIPWNVFPVTWSSSDPLGELPIDLCVYNFFIPIAVKALNPSQALTGMYKWWFRWCARVLRLSHFLFDERSEDEEGYWEGDAVQAEPYSPTEEMINGELEDSNPSTYEQSFYDMEGNADSMEVEYSSGPITESKEDVAETERHFIRTGRFVRAPATDRVRIPRGHQTFLPVDENNNRLDSKPEANEGLHAKSNSQFQLVYLPPNFQLRIGAFAVLLWCFATVTGLLTTILPLSVGRFALSRVVPPGIPTKDIHAYIFGAYLLGAPLLLAVRHKQKMTSAMNKLKKVIGGDVAASAIGPTASRLVRIFLRAIRVLYFYSFAGFILPTLFSSIFWFYVAVPISTLMGGSVSYEGHAMSVSLVQNWVLGILFMRVAGRVVQNHQESRVTRALYAIVARNNNGASWLNPDVKLATRAFILPSLTMTGVSLMTPLTLGYLANISYFRTYSMDHKILVYRYSYPLVAGLIVAALLLRFLNQAYIKWRSRIRDEVYLVGERLHNFGERRTVVSARVATSA